MKTSIVYLIIGLLLINSLKAQVKIGNNPQNLHPASVLELESPTRVLVITRVTDAQMSVINPLPGAMVYNTDQDCLHYYNGTQWINICEALDNSFTVSTRPDYFSTINPAQSKDSTVVISQTENPDGSINYNYEVGLIRGANIVNTTINGDSKIQAESITTQLLAPKSVTIGKFADAQGGAAGDIFQWNGSQWTLVNESVLGITEKDSIVGNEVVGPFDSTLTLEGDGDQDNPYTLDVAPLGIDTPELADEAVTTLKILDGNITNAKLDKTNIPLSGFGAADADVDLGNNRIINLADPTNPLDAVNLQSLNDAIATSAANDLDTDPENELSDISLTGTLLELTNAETGAVGVDLDNTFATDAELTALNTDDADADPENELSDISLTGTLLELTNAETGAVGVDLDNTFATDAELTALNTDDADADPENELSDISLTGTLLELTNAETGAVGVDLDNTFATDAELTALNTDDADADPENELSDISLTGTLLELTNAETGAVGVDLDNTFATDAELTALNTDDADADPENELSDISLTGTLLELTNAEAGAVGVDLDNTFATDAELTALNTDDADADPENELSDISLTGTLLELTNAETGAVGVDLDNTFATDAELTALNTDDADADPENELSDISLTGTLLELTNAEAGAVGVDLDNTFATDAELTALNTDDADADPENELSDLSLTGTLLELTNAETGAVGVDLDNNITSDMIADGTITNADINANAAIDGSKIDPVFIGDVTSTGDFLDNQPPPDFVFQKYYQGFSDLNNDYIFKSLNEIELFLKKNNHLPGVKSAYEIIDSGKYNLTESSLVHLEKIEELFLHTIEQEKKIVTLQSDNQKLAEELDSLKNEMKEIKAMLLKNSQN